MPPNKLHHKCLPWRIYSYCVSIYIYSLIQTVKWYQTVRPAASCIYHSNFAQTDSLLKMWKVPKVKTEVDVWKERISVLKECL